MVKIRLQLDPRRQYGQRISIIEEPVVKDTPAKLKSRLRNKRNRKESDDMPDGNVDKRPDDVHVSTVNWKGRRERS